jgi:hypothetical protein
MNRMKNLSDDGRKKHENQKPKTHESSHTLQQKLN